MGARGESDFGVLGDFYPDDDPARLSQAPPSPAGPRRMPVGAISAPRPSPARRRRGCGSQSPH